MSAFREMHERFAGENAQVLGVSTDDLETQKKFAESLKLPFPLLADHDGVAARAYGVLGVAGMKYAQRFTFVIDGGGRVVQVIEGKEAIDPSGALAACPLHKKAN